MREIDIAIHRYTIVLRLGMLLWAVLGPALALPADAAAMAQSLRAMMAQPARPTSSADASRAQVRSFYAARNFRPAWADPDTVPAFVAAMYTLVDDGLNPVDYGAQRLAAEYRRA